MAYGKAKPELGIVEQSPADRHSVTSTGSVRVADVLRVLIVEDEFFVATEIARALTKAGAQVVGPVATISEARKLCHSAKPIDAAVLDIGLRGERVYSFADDLLHDGTPFVFATAFGIEEIPRRFRSIPRFEKPFDADSIADAIVCTLSGSQ
jgi:DNA-binding NarL/FixJ family response regulator